MLQSEFEERVGFTVTSDCYHECIEPEYNASKLGKDEWCKQWKKDHGIQRAYSWMAKQLENLNRCYEDASNRLADYDAKVKEINLLKNEAQVNADTLADRNKQISDLCAFLIEQSQTLGTMELRNKAIQLMGAKDYLRYKLVHDMPLWEADRNLLIDFID